jgi:ABC-type Fe3+ transport system permease subunit
MGFGLLLLAVVGHVLVDGWHLWEHHHLRDPVVPHLLLASLKTVMLAGVVTAIPTTTTSISIWSGDGTKRPQ